MKTDGILARLGNAVKTRREALGLTQAALAKLTEYSSANQSRFENGTQRPPDEMLERIADALQTTIAQLYLDADGVDGDNIAPAPDIVEMLPLIGTGPAGAFRHVRELERHEVEEWYPSLKKFHGKGFCLRVSGDSMTSPSGRSYPEGTIAIFDTGDRDPPTGSLVLAKIEGADEITFKKYIRDAGMAWLMPLNPEYPRIDKPFRILATFRGAFID